MSEEQMRIRGELFWEGCGFERLPEFDDQILPALNPDLHSPENADQLLKARLDMMDHPQGVTIDAFQAVTSLELKFPEGSIENQHRSLTGLRGEVSELGKELEQAREENPFRTIGPEFQETSEYWIHDMLDFERLRFTDLSASRKEHYIAEEGDVLWYAARVAAEIDRDLSYCFVRFMCESPRGKPLQQRVEDGKWDQIVKEAHRALSFEVIQKMSLDNKTAYSVLDEVEGERQHASIDSNPGRILTSIAESLKPPEGVEDQWSPNQPYMQIPDLEISLGKLVWFVAYTSETLLNTELGKVMQANLEKITARSARGTAFSKRFRDKNDEASIRASEYRRMPMQRPHV